MRVLIADDHVLFRRSLKALLESRGFDVVAEAGDGMEAVEQAAEVSMDLVLMDLDMPRLDGLEAMRRILAARPELRVVVLTGVEDDDKLLDAMEHGAAGYLVKTLPPERFFSLLDGLLEGRPALPPELAHSALVRLAGGDRRRGGGERGGGEQGGGESGGGGRGGGRPDPMRLTDRETEVLSLMASGVTSSRGLAHRLGVSERTVKFHVGHVLEKLQVDNRAEAVGLALRRGLVEPAEADADGG